MTLGDYYHELAKQYALVMEKTIVLPVVYQRLCGIETASLVFKL